MEIRSSVVVVLESMELKSPEVTESAKMIPLALSGKTVKTRSAIQVCNPVFSTAIANMNPPRKR
jgi:hypothetical protein